MGPIDGFNHLINFVLPALALALCMAGPVRRVTRRKALATGFWPAFATHFVVGVLVLVLGLWFLGQDGKMATYAVLATCSASAQWILDRSWAA